MAYPLENTKAMARALADGKFNELVKPSGPAEIAHLGQALNQTAQALRHSFESLSIERERLGSILAQLPVGVILCQTKGRVILSNPAAAHLLHFQEVMTGRPSTPWSGKQNCWSLFRGVWPVSAITAPPPWSIPVRPACSESWLPVLDQTAPDLFSSCSRILQT
ncbi:HAMP domain-containing protein [Desulfosporosinus shakirovi]|uniref:HAMP domain-containing protein n=1 Tax=Desulfosporosinus shakirovi TaxID=2885154 RepID=UPI001E3CB065|nr:HAMP domain-containing protein [Desulfosporosinus sp. SRJS8]